MQHLVEQFLEAEFGYFVSIRKVSGGSVTHVSCLPIRTSHGLPEVQTGGSSGKDTTLVALVLIGIGSARVVPNGLPVVVRIYRWVGEDQLNGSSVSL